jgi:hypothetical protein
MGDRIKEGKCIMCGEKLVYPYNDLRACSKCTPVLLNAIQQIKIKARNKNRPVVNRANVVVPTTPLGVKAE